MRPSSPLDLGADDYVAKTLRYSHLTGHYPGGQAEYVRVPFADVCPTKVPDGLTDEQVLFLTDIFPMGYQGAEFAQIEPGDTVAVWGCGPVGQFCIRSAFMFNAGRVIAIVRHLQEQGRRLHQGRDDAARLERHARQNQQRKRRTTRRVL